MAALILLAFACSGGGGIESCDRLGDPINREECRYDAVKKVIADPAALDAALARIPDDASRDLVLYRLAIDSPERATDLCRRTKTPAMQDKCAKVIGRPHLQQAPGQ